MADSLVID